MTYGFQRAHVLSGRGPFGRALAPPWLPDAAPPTPSTIGISDADVIVDAQAWDGDTRTVTTLQAAVDHILHDSITTGARHPRRILVRPGFYTGPVILPRELPPISFHGAGRDQVTIAARIDAAMSGDEYARRFEARFEQAHPVIRAAIAKIAARDRIGTHNSAVLRIACDGATLSGMTIRNDYACDRIEATPPGEEPDAEGRFSRGQHQAVALHCAGADRLHLHGLRLSSFQDTLYLQAPAPDLGSNRGDIARICLDHCEIEGDVDFIFGNATAHFTACEIRARGLRAAPIWVTAPSTALDMPFGFVFEQCRFTHDGEEAGQAGRSFLGRQWFEGVRATPYGRPPDPGYRCRLTDVNRLATLDGQISHSTLRAVGKCTIIRSEIGPHIDMQHPWDSWMGPDWSPRFRPAQLDMADFRRHLTPWLIDQDFDMAHFPQTEPWLQLLECVQPHFCGPPFSSVSGTDGRMFRTDGVGHDFTV